MQIIVFSKCSYIQDILFQNGRISKRFSFLYSGSEREGMLHIKPCTVSNWNIKTKENVISYFFSYKMDLFSFQNNPRDLDPSYKMDLDLWDWFGRVKLVL